MWKPAQRIKYAATGGRWPSAAEAATARLFAPVKVGPLPLANRTWVPAMVPWRATEDGAVTADVIDWYRRFAQGRPGAIVVEATGIRDVPSGPLLRAGHDRFIAGLRQLADAVREGSDGQTRLLIQLIDFLNIRRRPERGKFLGRFLELRQHHFAACGSTDEDTVRQRLAAMTDDQLADVLAPRELEDLQQGYRERVTDLHLEHIRELPATLPGLFAAAAARVREAGFDGVELHYAHAYTMASFLSALNTRDDGYGGDRTARVRLPLEVYAAVRAAVGEDYALGCRFLSQDCIAGGSDVADSEWFATQFAAAGMDFLSLSRGGKFEDAKRPRVGWAAYPYTGPSGYECMPQYLSDERGPFGRNVAAVARIRGAVRAAGFDTPIVVAGGIHNFEQAENILAAGQADIVAFARQALADPDWFRKVRMGRGDEVRLCEYTNYCEGLDQKHKQVTCQLWDRLELEVPGVTRSADGKRRLLAPPWRPG